MTIDWVDPWRGLEQPESGRLEAELSRELSPGHILHNVPVTAIGRRGDRDDVLFRIDDGTGRFAVVHLTWVGRAEENPYFPQAKICEDVASCGAAR